MQLHKFVGSDSLEAVRFALDLLPLSVEIGSCGDGAEGCGTDAIVGGIAGLGLGSELSSEHNSFNGNGLWFAVWLIFTFAIAIAKVTKVTFHEFII